MPSATLYLVDGNPACRDSLRALVESLGGRAVEFATAAQFIAGFDPRGPACVVLEAQLPDRQAWEVQDWLRERGETLPVVIFTAHADVASVVACMKRGAIDYLEKPCAAEVLRKTLLEAMAGAAQWWEQRTAHEAVRERWNSLSPDEREVARRLVRGHTNSQIAAELDVSLRTVQFRRSSIMKKMAVHSKSELIALLLSLSQPRETKPPSWQPGDMMTAG